MRDNHYFNECRRDAFLMIAGGVIAIIAAFMLKSHVDGLGLTTGLLVYLMCGAGLMGGVCLVIGSALAISLFGQTVAQTLVEIYGLPSAGKRRLYSLLCGVNVLALISATATIALQFGAVWQTVMAIAMAIIGTCLTLGVCEELRELAEDEAEQAELELETELD